MIYIKILEDVFEVWKEFSPFMHRPLLTKKQFLQWAEKLKFLSSFSKKNEFYVFLEYLEKNDLLNPIIIEKRGSEIAQQMRSRRGVTYFGKPSGSKLDKIEKYYHPFQFFQFITFYNYLRTHSYEKSDFYYFAQKKWIEKYYNDDKIKAKKIKRINKEYSKWIRKTNKKTYSGFNRNIEKSDKYDKKTKKKMKRKNIRNMRERNKKKKTFDYWIPGLKQKYWLSPELLKIWIKIDSLIYFPEYIETPDNVDISHTEAGISDYDKEKRDEIFKKFLKWREKEVKKKDKFLNENEFEALKKLYSEIYWNYHRYNDTSDGIENWRDLIDLLPNEKIRKLTGFLNISVNIIKILRFIARFTWYFFEYNLEPWPENKEHEKPYFCFSEDPEIYDFRKSVLSDYDLFVDIPFILYVEGKTEENILNLYIKKKPWLKFKVKNIRGVDKNIYFLNLCKDIKERIYYFFLDYEDNNTYNTNKDSVRADGAFFFPDFITENFNPQEIEVSFKKWTSECNISISSTLEEEINKLLNKAKQESNKLLSQSIKTLNPKGYEEILLGILMQNFQQELLIKYTDLKHNPQSTSVDKEKLENKFKKTFTENYLVDLVEKSLEDKNRKKYSFEEKLEPFYTKINNYKLRNLKIQYDLKI